jgi:alpha-tubulin suppressor-like RCC1 family protein
MTRLCAILFYGLGLLALGLCADLRAASTLAGRVVAWGGGANFFGQTNVPAEVTAVTALAAGGSFTLALKLDGTVAAWGNNRDGQSTVPDGLSGVIALAAGDSHAVALKSDGTVVGWGSFGPPAVTNVGAIAAAGAHTIFLKRDGTLLGDGVSVPAELAGVKAVAAGPAHGVALKEDGTVVAWGENGSGQATVPEMLSGVTAVAAGTAHTLALKEDRTLIAWGDNSFGQSTIPQGLTGVTAIAAADYYSLALKEDGTVVAWGDNSGGQLNVPAGLVGVIAISAGPFHAAAVIQAPIITVQPLSQLLDVGASVDLSVSATGDEPLRYQWCKDGVIIIDATNAVYHISHLQPEQVGHYTAKVTGRFSSVSSTEAFLELSGNPIVVTPPQDVTVPVGRDASFITLATGRPPLSYQWRRGGVDISGATGPLYCLGKVRLNQSDNYSVVVSNAFGSATSAVATLTVTPATVAALSVFGRTSDSVPLGLTGFTAIAAGRVHTVALREDGAVVAWGDNTFGQTNVPEGLSNVTAIAAGAFHTVALTAGGRVVTLGRGDQGQTNTPPDLDGVATIAAGDFDSFAVKEDGRVVAWGNNGQAVAELPAGLKDVAAISARGSQKIALRRDGSVVAWGVQTDVPGSVTNVIAVAAGGGHLAALKRNGTVVAWGDEFYGQTQVPPELANAIALAAGGTFTVGLMAEGRAIAWGELAIPMNHFLANVNGIIAIAAGNFNHLAVLTIAPIIITQPVSRLVSPGENASFTVVATASGSVSYQWQKDGLNIVDATNATCVVPHAEIEHAGAYRVVLSSSGGGISGNVTSAVATLMVALAPLITAQPIDQTVRVGEPASFSVDAIGAQPMTYQWRKEDINIRAGTNRLFALPIAMTEDAGSYDVVIANQFGSVTSAVERLTVLSPPVITAQPRSQTLTAGETASLSIKNTGTPAPSYQWRKDGVDVEGATGALFSLGKVHPGQAGTYTIVVSNGLGSVTSSVATLEISEGFAGKVVGWGVHDGSQTVAPDSLDGVIDVAAGGAHTVAVKQDGTVVAWGSDEDGQSSVPPGLRNVVAVAAGTYHSAALRANGTVRAWGDVLADPGVTSGVRGAAALAAGYAFTVVLARNGTVGAWGDAIFGETVVPAGLSGVIAVEAGDSHLVALTEDGTIVAWGRAFDGQTSVPEGLGAVTAIAAGGAHTVALKSDGTVVAWGRNEEGQATVPAGLSDVTAIAAGRFHSVALKKDGTVVAWGDNSVGQTEVPAGLNGVSAISAGDQHTVAVVAPPRSVAADPVSQTLSVGQAMLLTARTSGPGLATYQWRKDGVDIESATNAQFTVPNVSVAQAGRYVVVASNFGGSVTSGVATVNIVDDAIFVRQPQSQNVVVGQSVTLSAVAAGAPPLLYQWYFNESPIPGANSATLVLQDFRVEQTGDYRLLVVNGRGSALSEGARLTAVYAPRITKQPRSVTVPRGDEVTFTVWADGTSPVGYQWFKGDRLIPGAEESEYTFLASEGEAVGGYWVVVSNAWGTVTSVVATLTFLAPPTIVDQPRSQRVGSGTSVQFNVRVTGGAPFTYQWKREGADIQDATGSSLTLLAVTTLQTGHYRVAVGNAAGSVMSEVALLTVIEPPRLQVQRLLGYPLLTLQGTPGHNYAMQYSLDAAGTNWSTMVLFTNLLASPRMFIDVSPATNGARFYRAVDY